MITTVTKRDGLVVSFDKNKIVEAIRKAMKEVNDIDLDVAEQIAEEIEIEGDSSLAYGVEEIQDLVEDKLIEYQCKEVAKAYIRYRDRRSQTRGNTTDSTVIELLQGANEYWSTENSNKDADIVTVQRDYLAGIVSTDISRRKILPKEICEAHDQGIIHEHDMDYLAQNALSNCCLINLEDMLQNGTVINGVSIDPQHRLSTATTVTTQIITAVASSQYGKSHLPY